MSSQQALFVIAHLEGVPIEKLGVGADDLVVIGRLAKEVKETAPPQSPNSSSARAPKSVARQVRLSVGSVEVGLLPEFVKPLIGAGHKRAANAYQWLSLFENSIRELIKRVLEGEHGADWWDKGVSKKIRSKAARFMSHDAQDPWHQPRGDNPIHYIGLPDYSDIITDSDNWPLFGPILDRQEFVTETLRGANVSRRVVAHMAQLDADDRDHLIANAKKWLKHLKAREHLIP